MCWVWNAFGNHIGQWKDTYKFYPFFKYIHASSMKREFFCSWGLYLVQQMPKNSILNHDHTFATKQYYEKKQHGFRHMFNLAKQSNPSSTFLEGQLLSTPLQTSSKWCPSFQSFKIRRNSYLFGFQKLASLWDFFIDSKTSTQRYATCEVFKRWISNNARPLRVRM